jgi:micrococcal nuclease
MYEYGCQVNRVVDGDTVDVILDLGFSILHKCRVRLYGIDTPESRTRDLDEKARGKLASKFLADAINNGKKVVLRSKLKDSKGKYGRVLGEIVVDDININVSMIENYLAVAYHGQSKNDIEAEHLVNRDKLIKLGVFTPNEQEGKKKT